METPLRGSESVVATERDVETELTETATADSVGGRRATPNFPKTRGAGALRAAPGSHFPAGELSLRVEEKKIKIF